MRNHMADIDEVKESIGFLKAIFLMLIAIDSSLIAWLFNHSELSTKSVVVICTIAFVTVVDLIIFKNIIKKIKSLKDL